MARLPATASAGRDCPLGKTAHMRKAAEMRKAAAGETILYRGDGTAFPAEYVITPLVHDESDFDEESNFNEKSQVEMETCIDVAATWARHPLSRHQPAHGSRSDEG